MVSSRLREELRHRMLRLRELRVGPTVFGLVVAVAATWVIVAAANVRDPEDTVEDYLTAVADKDVADALELVSHVYDRDTATFLTPEAISDDWWVESVTEVERDGSTAEVKAVIASPGGTATGWFSVYDHEDGWLLQNPFAVVTFPASPLSYVQVNDKIADKSRKQYKLFPGFYRFYRTAPGIATVPKAEVVAAFPERGTATSTPKEIRPGQLTAGKKSTAKAQRQLDALIDDCAGFTTKAPYGDCPFATDGEIDTPDGKRVIDLHSLKWTVERHPTIALTDDRSANPDAGFALHVNEPGTVRLTGGGTDTEGNPATFTVTCAIDLTGAEATVEADGAVRLSVPSRTDLGDDLDTCRQNT